MIAEYEKKPLCRFAVLVVLCAQPRGLVCRVVSLLLVHFFSCCILLLEFSIIVLPIALSFTKTDSRATVALELGQAISRLWIHSEILYDFYHGRDAPKDGSSALEWQISRSV